MRPVHEGQSKAKLRSQAPRIGLMTFSIPSIVISPLKRSPLMKKVGVRVDLEGVQPLLLHRVHGSVELLILETGLEFLLRESGLPQHLLQGIHRRLRLLHVGPALLLVEQQIGDGVVFRVAVAAGQHEGRGRQRIERKLSQRETNLAGVDVALLQSRPTVLVKRGTVRAGSSRHIR